MIAGWGQESGVKSRESGVMSQELRVQRINHYS